MIEIATKEIPIWTSACQLVMKILSVSITRQLIEHQILSRQDPNDPRAPKMRLTDFRPWFAMRVEASLTTRSALWQATCILLVMRCDSTCETQTHTTNGAPRMDVSRHQSAVLEMQNVLSRRLPSFYRCALQLLGNTADAEDAVQEALLAAYRHIDQFRGQAQLTTWLTAIVRNCALMQLRKRTRQIHLSLDEQIGEEKQCSVWESLADTRPSPEEECRNLELSARLQKCAALLSPTLRRTFQLRILMGFSIFETARILGLPHGTVKAQLARARKNIARHIKPGLAPRSRSPQRPDR
jgi:RNA polymerase sigma-70 factor (ECF subfamily)